jgi:signal transduction histidine kinase
MVSTTVVQQHVPASRADGAASVPVLSPSRRWLPPEALPSVYFLLVAAVLAFAGYPAWRISVVAAVAVVPPIGIYLLCTFASGHRGDPRNCVNADAEQIAWWAVGAMSKILVATALTVAITGGVRSPLLPTLTASYFSAVMMSGDRRATRFLLAATCVTAGAIALLPRAWTGPELSPGPYSALLLVSVLGVGAILAPAHARVHRWHADLARAREDMAAEALTRAQALEQIGTKVAHELKNPLTGVKALVQLGLRNPTEAPSHARLEVLEKEVTRMQDILHNYLSFTRPMQAFSPRAIELGPLVSETLLLLSARADEAGVKLYARGEAAIEADPRRLKEALLNLVANSIEATPSGGDVVVEVRPHGEETEIVIRDTGRGMPAETLRRLGTPFFTTRDDGTGLGVVLARTAIAQHGGSLRYESEPGRGTRVTVVLPHQATGGHDAACAPGR